MKLVAASSIWYDVADSVSTWPVDHPACVLVSTDGPLVAVGDVDRVLPWASVTKVLAALAVVGVVVLLVSAAVRRR